MLSRVEAVEGQANGKKRSRVRKLQLMEGIIGNTWKQKDWHMTGINGGQL